MPDLDTTDSPLSQSRPCSLNFLIFFWSFISLLRVAIGFHPHSGQDNHHGSADKGAYGGDFEAQRHWMELTIHVPINDWYWYDLEYWGLGTCIDYYLVKMIYLCLIFFLIDPIFYLLLDTQPDYPPLTAYVSWICGWASHYIVGPPK